MRGLRQWIGASGSDIVYGLSSTALDPVSLHDLEPPFAGATGGVIVGAFIPGFPVHCVDQFRNGLLHPF